MLSSSSQVENTSFWPLQSRAPEWQSGVESRARLTESCIQLSGQLSRPHSSLSALRRLLSHWWSPVCGPWNLNKSISVLNGQLLLLQSTSSRSQKLMSVCSAGSPLHRTYVIPIDFLSFLTYLWPVENPERIIILCYNKNSFSFVLAIKIAI